MLAQNAAAALILLASVAHIATAELVIPSSLGSATTINPARCTQVQLGVEPGSYDCSPTDWVNEHGHRSEAGKEDLVPTTPCPDGIGPGGYFFGWPKADGSNDSDGKCFTWTSAHVAKGTLMSCARTPDMTVCGKAAVMKAGSAHSAVLLQKRVKCTQISPGKQVCNVFKAGLCINLGSNDVYNSIWDKDVDDASKMAAAAAATQILIDSQTCYPLTSSVEGVQVLSGMAAQSSEALGGSPGRAVDGNTDPNYSGGSCTHTQQESSPWWRLTLDHAMSIARVEVWNRADGVSNRLNGVQIKVGLQLCGTLDATTSKQTVQCNGKIGAVVELSMPRTDFISLCEVKVFGNEVHQVCNTTLAPEHRCQTASIVSSDITWNDVQAAEDKITLF